MQTASITLYPRRPERRTRLARLGDRMARHRRAILIVQWLIVVFYLVLVALPAFLPHPHPEARLFSSDFGASSAIDPNLCTTGMQTPTDKAAYIACWQDRLVLLAQYLFWGVWWPFVILSIMLMGRVWCGVLPGRRAGRIRQPPRARRRDPEMDALGRLAGGGLHPHHRLWPAHQRL